MRRSPTVSLGYFQKVSESVDLAECRRRGVSIVRRRSGGSAIFTDRGQLIYGLVVSEPDLPSSREESFRLVCSGIARAVGSLGLDAAHRPINDVEVGGKKVSGSAQLRRRGSVLQHGTVIMDVDPGLMDAVLKPSSRAGRSAPTRPSERVASLSSLLGRPVPMRILKERLASEFEGVFGVEFHKGRLTRDERSLVRKAVEEKYGCDSWNLKF